MTPSLLKKITLSARILLILLMAATVVFIFVNSTFPPDKSQQQSDTVKDAILEILPEDSYAAEAVENDIRKVAHFTEYGLLGIELAVYLFIFERRRPWLLPAALLLPLFVGFIDESIQITSGRGPAISDVWIDIGGFATFYHLALAVLYLGLLAFLLVGRIVARAKKRTTENNNG